MRNKLCRWFCSLMAGRPIAYWIDDRIESDMAQFAESNLAGAGAAAVLVRAVSETGFSHAEYTLDGWSVTVQESEPKGTPK